VRAPAIVRGAIIARDRGALCTEEALIMAFARRLARIDPELLGLVRHRSAKAQIHLTVIRARAELVVPEPNW
jgi:hypothetical protein